MTRLVAFSLLMLTLVLGVSLSANATTILTATIDGGQEVPPNESSATGSAHIEFGANAQVIEWVIDFQGLSGPLAAAHFHEGPAGENGPVLIDILATSIVNLTEEGTAGRLVGRAVLTDEQVDSLLAGNFYVNLHTGEFPGGEIRGQVVGEGPPPVPEPATAMLVGAAGLLLAARRGRPLR